MRILSVVAALLFAVPMMMTGALAQTPKVIGTPQQPQIVPSMIVKGVSPGMRKVRELLPFQPVALNGSIAGSTRVTMTAARRPW